MTENNVQLPDIFPAGGEENIRTETIPFSAGTQSYSLAEKPSDILTVTGTLNGDDYTFEKGVDYKLSDDRDGIFWFDDSSNDVDNPDDGTDFSVEYREYDWNTDVSDEKHEYVVYDLNNGTDTKDEYVFDKAPIHKIQKITGTRNGDEHEFVKGTDYELSADCERVVWLNGDRPDRGTQFSVDYRTQSVIDRYINAHEDELDDTQQQFIDAINANFIDKAEGQQLDEIGKLFGDTIGARRGRGDDRYRSYLKSVVQSFISTGTKKGIKTAVAAGTGVDFDDLTIVENFDQTAYRIKLPQSISQDREFVQEIAEVADPSGVDFGAFQIDVGIEEVTADDAVSTRTGGDVVTDDGAGSTDKIEDTRTRSDDARWEQQSATHEVRWDFFEWTKFRQTVLQLDDEPTADETLSTDRQSTFEWQSASGTQYNWSFAEWQPEVAAQEIDTFEDGDLSEYTIVTDGGDVPEITTNNVKFGNYALYAKADSSNDQTSTIVSMPGDGLDFYPTRGDVFSVWLYHEPLTLGGGRPVVQWGTNSDLSDNYSIRFEYGKRQQTRLFRDYKYFQTTTELAKVDKVPPENEYFLAVIDWDSSNNAAGELTVSVYDKSLTFLYSISAVDTTYDSGGIGFWPEHDKTNPRTANVWWDHMVTGDQGSGYL